MTQTKKLKRHDTATFHDASGFSVSVLLSGYCAADHFPLCKSIEDVQRCATMGDFKILGYDLVSA